MTLTTEDCELILMAIESELLDVHTWIPCQVVKVNEATAISVRTVDVEIQVQRVLETDDGDLVPESIGIIHNVPIAYNCDNEYGLFFPCAKGTYGRIDCSEVSIDRWQTEGKDVDPGDIRRHDLSGAVFVPDLKPNKQAFLDLLTTGLVLGKIGGIQLRIDDTAAQVVTAAGPTASDFVALASKVDLIVSTLDNVIRTAWVAVPNDGGAALKAAYIAAFPTAPLTVASTNLKAD